MDKGRKTRVIVVMLSAACVFTGRAYAQNLIPNPSFEEARKCPSSTFDFDYVDGWKIFRGTPDYFSSCAEPGSPLGVPINFNGRRSTFAGIAYTGMYLSEISPFFNKKTSYLSGESISTRLLKPLQKNTEYELSFWISLADSSSFYTDSIYISFSTDPPVPAKVIKRVVGRWRMFKKSADYGCGLDFKIRGGWNQVVLRFKPVENYEFMSIGLPINKYSYADFKHDLLKPRLRNSDPKRFEISAYYYIDNFNMFKIE